MNYLESIGWDKWYREDMSREGQVLRKEEVVFIINGQTKGSQNISTIFGKKSEMWPFRVTLGNSPDKGESKNKILLLGKRLVWGTGWPKWQDGSESGHEHQKGRPWDTE